MKRNRRRKYTKILPYLFLPAGILLFYVGSFNHPLVENIYSEGLYRGIIKILSLITCFLPFSLAGIIIILLVIFVLWVLVRFIIKMVHGRGKRLRIILSLLSKAYITIGIIYFAFVFLWGLNYQRQPFSVIAGLEIKPAAVDELASVCQNIIDKANTLRGMTKEGSSRTMTVGGGYTDVFRRAGLGYEKVSSIYPELGGSYGMPKAFIPSVAMSYEGISGVYFPYTGEANVNIDMPMSFLPAAACHEMAHQRGFAREDEANYIAFLVCSLHPDADFQYSGYLLALVNSMNALYAHDPGKYAQLEKKYSPGVMRDLIENDNFWNSYKGPIQDISEKINDTYLKANMQADGIYSYGRMVDLLIAQYRRDGDI